jgi:hypothetical protein
MLRDDLERESAWQRDTVAMRVAGRVTALHAMIFSFSGSHLQPDE